MKLHINYLTFVSFMWKKRMCFFRFFGLVETTSIWHVLCLRRLCNKVCAQRMNKRAKRTKKKNYIAFVTLMMKYSEAVVWSISPKIKREEHRQRRPRQRRRTTGTSEKTNDKRIEYATVRSLMSVVGRMYLFSVFVHRARGIWTECTPCCTKSVSSMFYRTKPVDVSEKGKAERYARRRQRRPPR